MAKPRMDQSTQHFMSDGKLSEKDKKLLEAQSLGMNIPAPGVDRKAQVEAKIKRIKELRQRRVKVLKDFRIWCKKQHSAAYGMFKPIGPLVIIRLYLYAPPVKSKEAVVLTGWDDDGTRQDYKVEMFPYAKILQVGSNLPEDYKHLKPEDIVLIPDDMCSVEPNNEWKEWQYMKREKPSIDDDWPMPPKMLPSLTKWGRYIFKRDKFMPEETDDIYTFMVPVNMVRSNVDYEKIK